LVEAFASATAVYFKAVDNQHNEYSLVARLVQLGRTHVRCMVPQPDQSNLPVIAHAHLEVKLMLAGISSAFADEVYSASTSLPADKAISAVKDVVVAHEPLARQLCLENLKRSKLEEKVQDKHSVVLDFYLPLQVALAIYEAPGKCIDFNGACVFALWTESPGTTANLLSERQLWRAAMVSSYA
jgi:hypothetical protein